MKKCAIVFAMAIILLVPVTPTMADITDQPKTEAGRCFIVDYGNGLFYIYSPYNTTKSDDFGKTFSTLLKQQGDAGYCLATAFPITAHSDPSGYWVVFRKK